MLSLEDYREMMEDRPAKADEDQVNYREADTKERCGKCLHFFERKIDGYGVCEILRLPDNTPIEEDHVCDFFTRDGESFPLRPRAR
jgi:hypothetical protein